MRSRLIGYFGFLAAVVTFLVIFTALGFGSGSGRISIAKWVEMNTPEPASLLQSSNYYVSEFSARPVASLVSAPHKGWVDRYAAPRAGVITQTNTAVTSAAQYANELRCMTEAIYYEARGEKVTGRFAVAEVVMNRVHDKRYPNSICGVVYQGAKQHAAERQGCQFSFTCDGSLNGRLDMASWRYSRELAKLVMYGMGTKLTHNATHYHADYVDPYWAPSLKKTVRIGRHIFYRWNGTDDPSDADPAAPRATRSSHNAAAKTSGATG